MPHLGDLLRTALRVAMQMNRVIDIISTCSSGLRALCIAVPIMTKGNTSVVRLIFGQMQDREQYRPLETLV